MDRERYEREIEEILEKAGEKPSDQSRREPRGEPPRRRRSGASGGGLRLPSLKYNHLLLAGIGLVLLVGIRLMLVGPSLGWLYFFFAGVAMLVLAYVIYYRAPRARGGANRSPRMWRGRSIEPDEPPGRRRR